ncbi:MAG: LysR family transcriptional regulator [Neisseria sp.]|nr:LysR family transcriptional regulator [Neisseria sp.]
MYTLEQLKIFTAVCRHGSFSAAARALGRAQSGISQAIAHLEIEFDQPLFHREKGAVTLTANGAALLPAAEALLKHSRHFEQKLLSLSHNEEHRLTVAIEEGLYNDDLFDTLARLSPRFPLSNIEIITASTFDIETMIADGQAQLGVAYKDYEVQKELDFFFLGHHRFITVAAPGHPLAAAGRIDAEMLKQYRQIVHRSIGGKELWFSNTIAPQCWYANSYYTMLELALRNVGWADIPEKLAAPLLQNGRLRQLHLDFEPGGNLITVVGLQSRSHRPGVVTDYLVGELKKHYLT